MIKKIIILIFLFSFYGCSTYSSSKLSKRIITNEDDKWKSIESNQNQNSITSKWWTIFEDSKLDLIMEVFLSNNYDLKLAISSLESSKQLAVYNAGKLLPDINAQINNQRAEQYLYFDKGNFKKYLLNGTNISIYGNL